MKTTVTLIIFIISTFHSYASDSENELIEYLTKIKIEKGKLIEEISYQILVSGKNSNWIADIEIPFKKGEKIEITEACITNTKGEILRTLKKNEISTRSNRDYGTFYDDYFIKKFNLKWNNYPYVIKYAYTKIKSEFITITDWYPLIHEKIPTKKAILSIETPIDYKINFWSNDSTLKPLLRKNKKTKSYLWEIANQNEIEPEVFAPPFSELSRRIIVVPEVFNYGITGSLKSWKTFGNWQHELNKDLEELTENEKQIIDSLIENKTDTIEIIKTLYKYLQENTRYINISLDIGGIKPYPAAYVCENKFGDCKALTIYMKSILQHFGIKSFYTKIFAGVNPTRIIRDIPSQQSNHIILCVPLKNDTIWLENTSNTYPYNYLGTFTHDRFGFLIDKGRSKLVKTPSLTLKRVCSSSNSNVWINEIGVGTAETLYTFRGNNFETHKYLSTENSQQDQKEQINNQIKPKNSELTRWEYITPYADSAIIRLQTSFALKNQLKHVGKGKLLRTDNYLHFNFEKPEKRKYPIRINYPIYSSDTINYILPFINKYEIKQSDNIEIISEFGCYNESIDVVDNQIQTISNFKLHQGEYSLSQYSLFYAFIEQIRTAQRKSAILLNPI